MTNQIGPFPDASEGGQCPEGRPVVYFKETPKEKPVANFANTRPVSLATLKMILRLAVHISINADYWPMGSSRDEAQTQRVATLTRSVSDDAKQIEAIINAIIAGEGK